MIAVGCSVTMGEEPPGEAASSATTLPPQPQRGFQTAWTDVMGPTGAPTLASWGTGRADLFARAGDSLYQKTLTNNAWMPAGTDTWRLTTGLASDPSAVGWQGRNVDIVWRGTANQVIHYYWDGTESWKTEDLGGRIDGRPSVAVAADGTRMDVFARVGTQLWHRAWALGANTWSGWENVGPSIDSDPVAVSSGTGRIDLFYRATNGETRRYLWDGHANGHQYYQALSGESFVEQPSLGGYAKDIPAVAANDGTSSMVVFVQGGDDGIYKRVITAGNLVGTWARVDGCMSGAPAATYVGGRIDLVARSNSDGHAYHNYTSIFPSSTVGASPLCCGLVNNPACNGGGCVAGTTPQPNTGKCEPCGGINELCCGLTDTCNTGVCASSKYHINWCTNACGTAGRPPCARGFACDAASTYDEPSDSCVRCGHLGELTCNGTCLTSDIDPNPATNKCEACGHAGQRGCAGKCIGSNMDVNPATQVCEQCGHFNERSCHGVCTDDSTINNPQTGKCDTCGIELFPSCNGVCHNGLTEQNGVCVRPPPGASPDPSYCGQVGQVCCKHRKACESDAVGSVCHQDVNDHQFYCTYPPRPGQTSACPGGAAPKQVSLCAKCGLVDYALTGLFCSADDAKTLADALYPGCTVDPGGAQSVCPR
jgi:hypothetical protein